MDLISVAKRYAIKCHHDTNHKYDGKPYSVHLQLVVDYATKYSHLIEDGMVDVVVASGWTHDVIEDCRQTYNDVKLEVGELVAEITYALTNEKGKTRKERAGSVYYEGIRKVRYADFVKLCDRLANVKYSKESGSIMIDVYRKEHAQFEKELRSDMFCSMWDELKELLR
jgi:(p)ppGpp synthase/HD superfamily hydrolase